MLDDDTFFKNIKVLKPSTEYEINNNKIENKKEIWKWNYNPVDQKFDNVVNQFSDLLDEIMNNKIQDRKILLPLSGGIDSRTLFSKVYKNNKLILFSYEFENGFPENKTCESLSDTFNIPAYLFNISKGYIWEKMDQIYSGNQCFTDFTHPRQIAMIETMEDLGDCILLGHWGDVLFDC